MTDENKVQEEISVTNTEKRQNTRRRKNYRNGGTQTQKNTEVIENGEKREGKTSDIKYCMVNLWRMDLLRALAYDRRCFMPYLLRPSFGKTMFPDSRVCRLAS